MFFGYEVLLPSGIKHKLRNLVPFEGQRALLSKIFNDGGDLYVGGSVRNVLYVGLCDQIPSRATTLADINTEPGGAGMYARKAWQIGSVAQGNNIVRRNDFAAIEGPIITFLAQGANYSRSVRRFFMTTSSGPGDAGILLSVSGPLPQELLLLSTNAIGLSVKPSLGFFN